MIENTFLTGGQRLADHRNGTLSIAQAAKDDQGWYHCEAIGNQGEKAVGSLYIRVVGKIKSIIKHICKLIRQIKVYKSKQTFNI